MVFFWFRRDLRWEDNHGLFKCLSENENVQPIFIFDKEILNELKKDDPRVSFLYDTLSQMNHKIKSLGASIWILHGEVLEVFQKLNKTHSISAIYSNEDYEPYAIKRDQRVQDYFSKSGIPVHFYKDQVVFSPGEVLKNDGKPYTVYTPFKNKWLEVFKTIDFKRFPSEEYLNQLYRSKEKVIELSEIGFERSSIKVKDFRLEVLPQYAEKRDFPSDEGTSLLGPHLRFGTIGIRDLVLKSFSQSEIFLSELIWREFFMQILFHFPHVVKESFKSKYDSINWRNNKEEFERWCKGETGFPFVDAGMRELNETGYMQNRARMICASFLCKHLLIDWRWGEAYFASRLLDYELASNNGNWQWSAGTGCDAAPYFRIFNPYSQTKKFDSNLKYISQWVPEFQELHYPSPIVDHKLARERALKEYKLALENT